MLQAPNHHTQKDDPDYYALVYRCWHWEDFATRHAWSASLEHLWVNQYSERVRDRKIACQFVEIVPGKGSAYYGSMVIPKVEVDIGTLMKVEDEFVVNFSNTVEGRPHPITGEEQKDPPDWRAVVIDNGRIHHTGTILARIERRLNGEEWDPRPIQSQPQWSQNQRFETIYITIKESEKTVKARINAVSKFTDPPQNVMKVEEDALEEVVEEMEDYNMEDDDADAEASSYNGSELDIVGPIEEPSNEPPLPSLGHYTPLIACYDKCKSVLMGCNVTKLTYDDWLEGLTKEQICDVLFTLTDAQRNDVLVILRKVPLSVLCIQGAAGLGKTWVLMVLTKLMMVRGELVLMCSSSNAAVNNFAKRFRPINNNAKLVVRLHPERFELGEVMCYDPQKHRPDSFSMTKEKKRMEKFDFQDSLAFHMLCVCGVIDTTNPKLLELRVTYTHLSTLLQKPRDERDIRDLKMLRKWTKQLGEHIITIADIVCTTAITCNDKWLRRFRDQASVCIGDEATSLTVADAMIAWRGDHMKLILAGDEKQLGPSTIASKMKYQCSWGVKKPVNPLHPQAMCPLMTILRENNFPYWKIPEQMRVRPGLFDMANELFYDGVITYNINNRIGRHAAIFEAWVVTYATLK